MRAYLSKAHVEAVETGCAVAALGSEMPRQAPQVRRAATRRIKEMIDLVARQSPDWGQPGAHERALVTVATLVGALVLARAVDDPKLSDALREAALKHLTPAGADDLCTDAGVALRLKNMMNIISRCSGDLTESEHGMAAASEAADPARSDRDGRIGRDRRGDRAGASRRRLPGVRHLSRPSGDEVAGIEYLACDVTSDESVKAAVGQVLDKAGRIDLLVNNAGVGLVAGAEESSLEQAKSLFDVNLFGVVRMTNAVLPIMRRQGAGRIVNISSVMGLIPAPFMALYAASKHAVEGYSESLDHETRSAGIRVVLVEPAYTRTSFEGNVYQADQHWTSISPHERTPRESCGTR